MKTEHIYFNRPLRDCRLVGELGDTGSTQRLASGWNQPAGKNAQLIETDSSQPAIPSVPQPDYSELLGLIATQIGRNQDQRLELMGQFQELAVQLAAKIAESIVRHDVQQSIERIRELITTAINLNESKKPIEVHVNTIDLDKLTAILQDSPSLESEFQLKSDDAIQVGNCRIESGETTLIADWQQQLADIQLQLMEYLHESRLNNRTTESSDS